MNENRKLPTNWQGHWRASPLDVYVAMVDDTKLETKQQVAVLTQHLTGAYTGSLPQVPDWFAEGVARNVAITTAPRGDSRIENWRTHVAGCGSHGRQVGDVARRPLG